jgi:hypothetical protein
MQILNGSFLYNYPGDSRSFLSHQGEASTGFLCASRREMQERNKEGIHQDNCTSFAHLIIAFTFTHKAKHDLLK